MPCLECYTRALAGAAGSGSEVSGCRCVFDWLMRCVWVACGLCVPCCLVETRTDPLDVRAATRVTSDGGSGHRNSVSNGNVRPAARPAALFTPEQRRRRLKPWNHCYGPGGGGWAGLARGGAATRARLRNSAARCRPLLAVHPLAVYKHLHAPLQRLLLLQARDDKAGGQRQCAMCAFANWGHMCLQAQRVFPSCWCVSIQCFVITRTARSRAGAGAARSRSHKLRG